MDHGKGGDKNGLRGLEESRLTVHEGFGPRVSHFEFTPVSKKSVTRELQQMCPVPSEDECAHRLPVTGWDKVNNQRGFPLP